jgi:non-specific serine/threonine protein kinase/serine/threonine-protein kinase
MNGGRREKVREIVAGAVDLHPSERPAYLERACGADAELRQDVETLLNAGDSARIGPYRIVREIGRGGMGTVYLGERDDGQLEQRVAIKVIERGIDSAALLRRFFDERRRLDRLHHANIGRLFDAGMFEDRAYFAMEYAEGEPIVDYANRRELSIHDRIRLFLPVCGAVEHGHGKLIPHGGIKAGNILVDSSGAPKLLDFGIASPEQLRGEPLTTATDVYGLGLVLFELLAGDRPYNLQAGDEPLPWPSELADGPAARILKGDLDDIILKAIERDDEARYQRAGDLAADLQRYLQRLPVQARQYGRLYRMRKFAARNRAWLSVGIVAALLLGFAIENALVRGRRAQRRFDDLRQFAGSFPFEFHDAIATLPGSAPARELVEKRALQYLDTLSRDAAGDTGLERELAESYLRLGDAQGLSREANLGKPAEALDSYRKAVSLLTNIAHASPSDMRAQDDLALAETELASAMASTGDAKKAWNMLEDLASSLESFNRKQPLDAPGKLILGRTYFGIAEFEKAANRHNESLQSRLRSVEIFRDLARDPNNREALRWYATSEKRLASLYLIQLHNPAKAAESLDTAIDIDRRRVAQNPNDAAAELDLTLGQSYMAALLQRKGDLAGAHRLYETTMAVRRSLLAADPNNYRLRYLLVTDYVHFGDLLVLQRNAAAARAAYREGLAVALPLEPKAGADPDALKTISDLRRKSM